MDKLFTITNTACRIRPEEMIFMKNLEKLKTKQLRIPLKNLQVLHR